MPGEILGEAFIRVTADLSGLQAQIEAAATKAASIIEEELNGAFRVAAAQAEPLNAKLNKIGEGAGAKIGENISAGVREGATAAAEGLQPINAGLAEVSANAKKAGAEIAASMDAAAASVKKSGESIAEVGKSLSLYVTAPLAIAGGASVKFATDFQSSMELLHTQAGATQKQVDSMSKAVLQMGPAVGTTANQLSTGLYHLVSQGEQGAQALNTLKIAAEGAKVGQANLEDVTNALGAVVVSGIKGSEDYASAMGVLNATVGAGDMRMQQLADAMGTGLPAKAAVFGVSLQQAAGALAVFGDNNIRGAEAGTLLNSTIRLMGAPSAAAAKALASVGLASTTLANDMRQGGIVQAVQDLKDHMDKMGLSASQQAEVLTRAFGGKQAGGVLVLMDQIDRLKNKVKEVTDGGDKFGQSWAATQKTFSFQFDQMRASAEKLGIELGNILMPYATKLASAISDAAAKFGDLSQHTQNMIVAIAAVAAAIGPLVLIVGKLVSVVGSLGEALVFVADNPIVLLIAGIAAFAAAMAAAVLFPKKLQQGLEAMGLSATTSEKIVTDLQKAFQVLSQAAQALAPIIVQAWNTAKAAFTAAFTVIQKTIEAIQEIWSVWGHDISAVVKVAFDLVKTEVTTDLKVLQGVFQVFTDVLTGNWSKAWTALKDTLGAVLQGMVNEVGTVLAAIPGKIMGIKIPGASEIHSFGEAMKSWTIAGQTAGQNFTDGLGASMGAATDVLAKAAHGVSLQSPGAGTGDVKDFIADLIKSFGGNPNGPSAKILANWQRMEGGSTNNSAAFNFLNTTLGEPGSKSINSVGVQAYTSFKQGLQATISTLTKGYPAIINAISTGNWTPTPELAKELQKWSGGGYSAILGTGSSTTTGGGTTGGAGNPNFNLGGSTKKPASVASSKTSLQNQFNSMIDTVKQSGQKLSAATQDQIAKVNAEIGGVANKSTLTKAKADFTALHTTVKDELSALKQDVTLNKTYDALKTATSELGTKVAPDIAAKMKAINADLKNVSTPADAAAVKKQMTVLETEMKTALAQTKNEITATNLFDGLKTQAAKLHADVTPAITAAMKQIQDEISQPVTAAGLAKIKSQVSQVKAAITAALTAAKQQIQNEQTQFQNLFGNIASGIDSSFQRATNKALQAMQVMVNSPAGSFLFGGSITETPAQKTIDQMQQAHQTAQDAQAVADAQTQLTQAQTALAALGNPTAASLAAASDKYNKLVAQATVAQQQLAHMQADTTGKYTAAQVALQQASVQTLQDQTTAAQTALQNLIAPTDATTKDAATTLQQAQTQLNDALYQQTIDGLQQQATVEQTAAQKQLQDAQDAYQQQRDVLQASMDQRLSILETGMENGTITVQQGMADMTAVLDDPQYQLDVNNSAIAIGGQIYTGLSQGLQPAFDLLTKLQNDMKSLGVLPNQGTTYPGGLGNETYAAGGDPAIIAALGQVHDATTAVTDAVNNQTDTIKKTSTSSKVTVNAYTNPNIVAAIR